MSQSQEVPIVILDVDPQDHPDYHAPELPLDDDTGADEQRHTFGENHPFISRIGYKLGKWAVLGTAAAVAFGGASVYLKNNMPSLPKVLPDAEHDLGVSITDVESFAVHNKTIDFLDVTSTFNYDQSTSLDRFGPANCDTVIDKKMTSKAEGEITLQTVEVEIKDKKTAKLKVSGTIHSETSLDISDNNIIPNVGAGGVDVCSINAAGIYDKNGKERPDKDLDEQDWAEKIALINTGNAADIAYACASQQEGEAALEEAIKFQATKFSEKLSGIDADKIDVYFVEDYQSYADAEVDRAVSNFYRDFEDISDRYKLVTMEDKDGDKDKSAHKIELDANELTDCPQHKITVGKKDN